MPEKIDGSHCLRKVLEPDQLYNVMFIILSHEDHKRFFDDPYRSLYRKIKPTVKLAKLLPGPNLAGTFVDEQTGRNLTVRNKPFRFHKAPIGEFDLSANSAKVAPDGLRRGTSCLPSYFCAGPKFCLIQQRCPYSLAKHSQLRLWSGGKQEGLQTFSVPLSQRLDHFRDCVFCIVHGAYWQHLNDRVCDKGAIKLLQTRRCDRGFRE